MTAQSPLAVTGSTGAIGGLVARGLAAAGVHQRLLVRDAARAPQLEGADVVEAAYGDTAAAHRALEGVSVLFMVSASESADRVKQHVGFVDAAAAAGVGHIVYTSFVGAAPDAVFTLARDHFATEERIRASGMAYTLLRDNLYLDFLPSLAGEDGVIRGPAGSGRVAAVARADVGRCAAAVLLDPAAHRDAAYELTGPEALSMADVAAIVGEQQGRAVSYHDETIEEAYASRLQWPAPDWQYDAWVSTYTSIAAGELSAVSDDVRRLTGRSPVGLRELLVAEGGA
ncbi:SDR family oxidoreductase [Nocardioides sp. R-C-SC26]|uniref:SDR family oxidoreductase n=1 Tax=Nocardioides sp. R-C-SC26 TaxID=2870414 RepID=UPI001E2EAABB|nr:SDR family oxidoreductase [Nocardioides sp. R-C-SC26]